MSKWEHKRLDDILKIQNGYAFDAEQFNSEGIGIPIIRIRDLAKGFSGTFYSGSYDPKYVVKYGDFLIGMDGEFRCYRWKGKEALLNQRVCRLVDFSRDALPEFIFYGINRHLETIEINTGFVTVKHLSSRQIEDIEFPITPLPEQERIVQVLDEVEEMKQLRAQANLRTAFLVPALFDEMFGNPFVNSRGWSSVKVDDVCDLVRGSSPRPKGDPRYFGGPIPRLMVEDITRDGWFVTPKIDSLTSEGARFSRFVKAGTIVMAVSGEVGVCAQVVVDACIHDGFVAFKNLNESMFDAFFFGQAVSFLKKENQRVQAGAVFQNITTSDVKALQVISPPINLQRDFTDRAREIFQLEDSQEEGSKMLGFLMQSLLQRAFEGEL